jgi:mannan endo-1,4-beta-mannosidase
MLSMMNFYSRISLYLALFFVLTSFIIACTVHKQNKYKTDVSNPALVSLPEVKRYMADTRATNETAALFYNLQRIAKTKIMFGHMEDNMNGYSGWSKVYGRSDVFNVTGAYPAVYGFDFGGITSFHRGNYIKDEMKNIHDHVIEAYKRNGIITFSWHYSNPVSKGSFYWAQSPVKAVSDILPGGKYNMVFKKSLTEIAYFAATVKYNNQLIPIVFRPFHEFNGDWFWWGQVHCSADDYKSLYRYTVTYLRDSLHVRNFLYAWSPDCGFTNLAQYTERYPGSAYVDVIGLDDYFDLKPGKSPTIAAGKLKIVSDFAIEQHKVAAFTETGLENLPQADWYTTMLLKAMEIDSLKIAYVMVWSNRPKSFWTPYKGHPAAADFLRFKNDPRMLFGDPAMRIYKIN